MAGRRRNWRHGAGDRERGITLPGSAVSSLQIKVDDYSALRAMIRNDYNSRLVDILDLQV